MRLLLSLILSLQSFACQVPVFRYALERWQADEFRLQLITKGALPTDLEKNLLDLQTELNSPNCQLNLALEVLDLNKLTPNQQLSVVGLEHVQTYPSFLLHPPDSWPTSTPLAFPGDQSSLQSILDSPLRHRIKKDLLDGESTVWILVEGSDEAANEATYKLLNETLKTAQDKIKIPEGVIQADQVGKVGEDIELDDVLRSSIPLKISFKIERLLLNDPAEQAFLKILTANRPPLGDQPLVVPVFGRGRTPGPLPGSSITADRIMTACEYLCGACSCQVKSGNPGYDLLIKANWQEKLQSGLIVVEKELPTVLPTLSEENHPAHTTDTNEASKPPQVSFLFIGIVAITLLLGSFILLRKPSS